MSRYYGLNVRIDRVPRDRLQDVISALKCERFECINDDCFIEFEDGFSLSHSEEGRLESEDEFTTRITYSVWGACESFVQVIINATYLEDLPSEQYELDQEDYDRYLKRKETDHGNS